MFRLATSLFHLLPPETAHHLAIKMLRYFPVHNVLTNIDISKLHQEYFGRQFIHPIGLAAGFDKDAEVFDKLGNLGFSFLEIGSVTPEPQPGNPKPRLFRLPECQGIINRYGFNSIGIKKVSENLQRYKKTCITGVNLGKNKNTNEDDFITGAAALAKYADYLTINVSSPNTPGLRDLQKPEFLKPMLAGIKNIIHQQSLKIPLFVKLSPDMNSSEETELITFLTEENIDGIIISNTTTNKEFAKGKYRSESGGLSGTPLREPSTAMLRRAYKITQGKILLIGCGGINSGQAAYEKLQAGANLLQLYTAFIYQGPHILPRVITELNNLLDRDGVKNVGEVIGKSF